MLQEVLIPLYLADIYERPTDAHRLHVSTCVVVLKQIVQVYQISLDIPFYSNTCLRLGGVLEYFHLVIILFLFDIEMERTSSSQHFPLMLLSIC